VLVVAEGLDAGARERVMMDFVMVAVDLDTHDASVNILGPVE
jgi:hypothetical protein